MKIFPGRKPNRLSGYDYSRAGWYFVTICVKDMVCVLGEVNDEKVILSEMGRIVWQCFNNIPKFYRNAELDEWIVMPNHLHAIIVIKDINTVGTAQCAVPTRYGLLSKIIKSFKTITGKEIRIKDNNFSWQRSFYDHIIDFRKNELECIRDYIKNNPLKWQFEQDNPGNLWD